MMKHGHLFLLILLYSLSTSAAADWPQFRGPDRNDISKEAGLLKSWPPGGPKLLWTFRDAGIGYSSMSIVGDRLYSMGAENDTEYVYAVDLRIQKKIWSVEIGRLRKELNGDGPCSTPTVDGGFVYALGGHGRLMCVDAATGKKVWSTELGDQAPQYGYTESVLVDGGQVVATPGGPDGAVAAFDKRTGALKWRCAACKDQARCASMIAIEASGIRQYVQATQGKLIGVRSSDGNLLWSCPKNLGSVVSMPTPIYHNDCIHISSFNRSRLFKLRRLGDTFEVELMYVNMKMLNYHEGLVLLDKHLYGYSTGIGEEGGWMCQDFQTGKSMWEKPLRGIGKGSVVYADGNLYGYHDKRGDVLLIQATPAGYKEQGKFCIPEASRWRSNARNRRMGMARGVYTHPVVANGKLYIRDQELIFCYDIRQGKGL